MYNIYLIFNLVVKNSVIQLFPNHIAKYFK